MNKTLDFLEMNVKQFSLNVDSNSNDKIYLNNLNSLTNLNIFVNENSNVEIYIFNTKENLDLKISGEIKTNSVLNIYYVDFNDINVKILADLALISQNSQAIWNSSVLSLKENNKRIVVNFDHVSDKTVSVMKNYGVAMNKSTLNFEGCSHIEENSAKSKALQTAKIIIYDEDCKAKANPILRIDNNDIEANHAAAVGTLNEDHVYYLLSRGISLNEARKLITLGYLTNVLNDLNEDDKKILLKELEERF